MGRTTSGQSPPGIGLGGQRPSSNAATLEQAPVTHAQLGVAGGPPLTHEDFQDFRRYAGRIEFDELSAPFGLSYVPPVIPVTLHSVVHSNTFPYRTRLPCNTRLSCIWCKSKDSAAPCEALRPANNSVPRKFTPHRTPNQRSPPQDHPQPFWVQVTPASRRRLPLRHTARSNR